MQPIEHADLAHLVRRVEAEYREMPGLCLTPGQARRLLGLDESRCAAVLGALVASGFLIQTDRGCFSRTDRP